MEAENYHIMMFPWLAFGHMLPYLELSRRLAAKGMLVSYVSTPRNLQRLPPIPSRLEAKLKLLEIQMQPVDGLPENCEATVDIQEEQTPLLKKAHDTLAEPFENLLKKWKPDLIIVDFAAYWISQVAAKFGIRTAFFSVYTAATLAFLGLPADLKSAKPHPNPDTDTDTMMRNTHVPDASGVSSGQRLGRIVEGCSFVLVRSCEEFEGKYLHQIQQLYQKPVLPIGLLPPNPIPEENKSSCSTTQCQWLDGQKPKSVLFVGFGSEYKMPLEQIHELAFSLELSRIAFIWILRKPLGVESSDLLPHGFTTRTHSQGVVLLGWAAQQQILAHPAIGGCLFHSGWGTTIESLSHGHPLLLLPMVSDQGLTAKLLVEKQVGYEVPRNADGSFTRDMLAQSIRRLLLQQDGNKLRLKAAQMQTVFGNHVTQDNYINKFIHHLKNIMV
ncbi:hypothetical protein C2S51_022496 [Perilla frutescens var. frutescens]|nr:hypothetical protein C2S51_022496 [Perilla frutescens var. frutescens]